MDGRPPTALAGLGRSKLNSKVPPIPASAGLTVHTGTPSPPATAYPRVCGAYPSVMMMNISVCPSERFPRLRGLPVFVCVLQPLYGFIAAWAGSVPIGFCERVSLCGFITAWAGMVRRFFWGSLSLVLGAFFSLARQQRLCSCCAACMPCRFGWLPWREIVRSLVFCACSGILGTRRQRAPSSGRSASPK